MKKLNLWLLASLFVAAFALSACGSDDDDNTPSGPTSIEGKWHAYVKSWGDGLCSRYNHDITYEFKSDKTFTVLADWSGGEEKALFCFSGSYTTSNGTITLNYKKAEYYQNGSYKEDESALYFIWDVYDPQTKEWSFDWQSDINPSAVALPYSISGTKMVFGNPNRNLVFHNHGLLTATFDWQGK